MKTHHIHIETKVEQDYTTVFNQFNEGLFKALQPPFPPSELLRFDGSEVGDEVHIKLFTGFKWQVWKSIITERTYGETEHEFVDKGVQLPFFLKHWEHRHRVRKENNGSTIIDDITLAFASPLLYPVFYPATYAQFAMRAPIYKKVFKKK
jgi:ligand-binding SRPBCC domain-containing protein